MVVTRRGRKVHTRKVSESINQAGNGSRFDSLTKDAEMETLAYENQSVDALFMVSTRLVSIMDTHEKGKVKYAKKVDIHRVGAQSKQKGQGGDPRKRYAPSNQHASRFPTYVKSHVESSCRYLMHEDFLRPYESFCR